jgi:hypothetical protein
MNQDVGQFVSSRNWSALTPALFALAGVAVGGVVTHALATRRASAERYGALRLRALEETELQLVRMLEMLYARLTNDSGFWAALTTSRTTYYPSAGLDWVGDIAVVQDFYRITSEWAKRKPDPPRLKTSWLEKS